MSNNRAPSLIEKMARLSVGLLHELDSSEQGVQYRVE